MTLKEIAEFVMNRLGDALQEAWDQSQRTEEFSEWESTFLQKLERSIRAVLNIICEVDDELVLSLGPAELTESLAALCLADWTVCEIKDQSSSFSSLASVEKTELMPDQKVLTTLSLSAKSQAVQPTSTSVFTRKNSDGVQECKPCHMRERGRSNKAARSSRRSGYRRRSRPSCGSILRRSDSSSSCASSVSSCSAGPSPTSVSASTHRVSMWCSWHSSGPWQRCRTLRSPQSCFLSPLDAIQCASESLWLSESLIGAGKEYLPFATGMEI